MQCNSISPAALLGNASYTIDPFRSHDFTRPRVDFARTSVTVHAYPSHGGKLEIKDPDMVVLEWLGLGPALETHTRSGPTVEDEDAFALRLMRIGAQWWPSDSFRHRHLSIDNDSPFFFNWPPRKDVGYPATGGVLVLRTPSRPEQAYTIPGDYPQRPKDFSRLYVSRSMSERCAVLEKFGATFYEKIDDCPDLPKSLEDGIEQAKAYVEKMVRMEDIHYRIEWKEKVRSIAVEVEDDEDEDDSPDLQDMGGSMCMASA